MTWPERLIPVSLRSTLKRLGWQTTREQQPLFSDTELDVIRQKARLSTPSELDLSMEVHYRLLGEQLSPQAKNGFEFAETRLYQPGDNIRFINWRRYASSGELYVNQFHEERRPQCWIVMDRRTPMQFGTRQQLKIRQAALYALYYIYKAQQHCMETGGVIMSQQANWYDAQQDSHSLLPLVRHINQPSPAAEQANSDNPGLLPDVLRNLGARLSPGSLIILCSDFSDLSAHESGLISGLSTRHTIMAVHIVDPVEVQLPDQGVYQILDPATGQTLEVNCNLASFRHSINKKLQARISDIHSIFSTTKCHYAQISTQENLLQNTVSNMQYAQW